MIILIKSDDAIVKQECFQNKNFNFQQIQQFDLFTPEFAVRTLKTILIWKNLICIYFQHTNLHMRFTKLVSSKTSLQNHSLQITNY